MATRLSTTMLNLCCLLLLSGASSALSASESVAPDPRDLIRAAMEHWRGVTSYSEMTMVIHRSDWERSFSMQAWTEGDKLSLVRVTEPKRDAGNGTDGHQKGHLFPRPQPMARPPLQPPWARKWPT